MLATDPLPMYWWRDQPNFGDALGPDLVALLTGRACLWSASPPRLCGVGSIVRHTRPGDVVWGSGIHNLRMKSDWAPREVRFLAVRGPLTRDYVRSLGAECPEIYGDPALLLPQVHPLVRVPVRELAVIPHLGDAAGREFARQQGLFAIDPRWPWQQVVAEIVGSQRVVSSSLHGMIAAEAYGVPATWAAFTESPEKFHDYWLGVGRSPAEPLPWAEGIRQTPSAIQQAAPGNLLNALQEFLSKADW